MAAPFTLWIQPTKRSNLDSILSYDVPDPDQPELSAEEIKRVLREMFERDLNSVFFEGGEPFLRDDFLSLVDFATPMAFTIVRTNGTLITHKTAARLKAANVAVVCVDIEGATAATHDRIVGTPGAFELSVRGARHLVEQGITTFVSTILTRHNIGELQAMAELTANIGAQKLGVLRLYPLGMARRNWTDLAVSLPEQMAALRSLRPKAGVKLMQSWHPNDPNCCWQMSAVDAYGNSIGCPYLRDFANYGNVRESTFRKIVDLPFGAPAAMTGA